MNFIDVFHFCDAHNRNIFTVGTCEDDTQIQITLTGGALKQEQAHGLYVKSAEINGKLSWIQTSTRKLSSVYGPSFGSALWWNIIDNEWVIGNKANIGSDLGWLYNPVQSGPPYGNANDWFYNNGTAWVKPVGEINFELQCTTESGK